MPQKLYINTLVKNPVNDEDDPTNSPVKRLTDIATSEAEEVSESLLAMEGKDAAEIPGTDGMMSDAVDPIYSDLTYYARDISGFSSQLPVGSNKSSYSDFGNFENYAVKMLYQDIATAFAQRLITGVTEATPGSPNPDKAICHYLTVAITSFVNRLAIEAVADTDGNVVVTVGTQLESEETDE